ncbi:uncharacterized protein CANTADRAFT_47915 [Suhomyces tanzawaensis NRRL Y-17324]|uniref:ATPase inhibitor, mitochondrial n=1 Tax=Suhomyces tanzawaensis NRRL Y-17324 TaxID=984487 RepID=A0A1E4SN88_9ASCO|nr:uncharacterized protein CANTADRAFT_47915 [Suhomyces tanzawaensis NRRL Y-17324]ODV80887.1 hypothetical protein CANTADRAFT_47915 [Suhomyces tanzawaensis NRRL Y-17324]
MLSQIARNLPRTSIRSFSAARVARTEGGSEAFNEREKAHENLYIKKHEAEQLKQLREKLQEHKETIEKLENQIKEIKK